MKFQSGHYKNNIKNGRWEKGEWTCGKCERQVRTLSNYSEGKKHGPQTEWQYDGKMKKNETYSKGELIIKEKYSRGKIETSTEYSGRLPLIVKKVGGQGWSVRNYQWPNSRITFYNHSGDIYETGFYGRTPTSGISVKTGVWKKFHTTGIVSSIRNYNKKAERHGVFRSYYRSGAPMAVGSYKDGAKIGTWHFFRKDGGPKKLENYDSRGVPNGKFCQWNYAGKRIRCTTLINGTGKRYRYSYRKNKKIKVDSITSLVNNKKHGKEITFKRGKKYSEVEWRNGKKHGLSIQYFAAHIRQQYKNGKREGKSCRSTKSSLWYGEFCDDKKCGTWFYQKPKETVERSHDGFGEEKYPTPKNASYDCPMGNGF